MILHVKTGRILSFFGIMAFWGSRRLRDRHESEATEINDFSSKNRGIDVIFLDFYVLHFSGDCTDPTLTREPSEQNR